MGFQEALNFPRSFYYDGVLNIERLQKNILEKLSKLVIQFRKRLFR